MAQRLRAQHAADYVLSSLNEELTGLQAERAAHEKEKGKESADAMFANKIRTASDANLMFCI
eukprot:SAG11_NODE_178_length_13331_cov_17.694906_5_plen_62_part_00